MSAVLPAVIMFAAEIIFGMFPFGEHSPLALDLNAQYVYYYEYMYDVFAGRESIFYSWSRSLSGEFLGLWAYYLASPFNFIIWLFPRAEVLSGIMVMQLVKASAVGFTSAVYLKMKRRFSDYTAMIFSVMFAMCGYFTAHTINPMWLDGLIALPLVIMGVEKVIDDRRFLLYTVSLLYIFIANYYIGYMVGIFSALYFFCYLISGRSSVKGFKQLVKSAAVYGFSSVSAILMSCPVIIPVYKSLAMGKLSYGDTEYPLEENFNIADIFIKLFPATYDTIRPEGLPMIYCGTLALIFAVIYFTMKRIPLRQRIAGGYLMGVLVLSMYIKPADMFWHGGQVPVWMPFRYSFILTYLLIMFGAESFEIFSADKSRRAKKVGAVCAALLAVLLFCDYYKGNEYFGTTLIIVIPMICLAVIAALLAAFVRFDKNNVMKTVLAGAVSAELIANCAITFQLAHEDIWYSSRESYVSEIPPAREVMDELRTLDDGFYRSEKTFHRTVNDPLALEMYGVSHSSSTYNRKVITLLDKLGWGGRDHYSRYDGATMLLDDIFGIKYILSKRADLVPYSDVVLAKNGISVYENKDVLPLAYLADMRIIDADIFGDSPLSIQAHLARRLMGDEDHTEFYHRVDDIIFNSENVSIGSTTDGHISYKKRINDETASVSYNVMMPHSGKAYAFFPSYYERECGLFVNDNYIKNYFENENHTAVYLGTYEAGEEFTVKLELHKNDMYLTEAMFFYLDDSELERFSETMREKNKETVVKKTGHASLEISVNAAEDCALFASIPFEDGWEAYIDGERVEILPAVDRTLTSIKVPAGAHTITMKFTSPGLKTGLMMMGLGVLILASLIVISKADSFPKKRKNRFPLPHETAAESDPEAEAENISQTEDENGNG